MLKNSHVPQMCLAFFFRKLKMSLNVFYYFLLISLFRTGVWKDWHNRQSSSSLLFFFFFWLFVIESFILFLMLSFNRT